MANEFKEDDKIAQTLLKEIAPLFFCKDAAFIEGIYLDECSMFQGYLTGVIVISVELRTGFTGTDFGKTVVEIQDRLKTLGYEVYIGAETFDNYNGYIRLEA